LPVKAWNNDDRCKAAWVSNALLPLLAISLRHYRGIGHLRTILRLLPKRFAAVTLIARTKSYERKENYPRTARQRAKLQGLAAGRGNANAHEQSRSRRRGGSRSTPRL